MVECETGTQGARIAALFARPRTQDRADQRGRAARASFDASSYMPIPGMPPPGIVSPGIADGAASMSTPRPSNSPAVPQVATRRQGRIFSTAISPATNAIQATLMIPSANSAAMRAQQQPTHQAPWAAPIRRAPVDPFRQEVSRNPSGLRHLLRQTFLNGVSS